VVAGAGATVRSADSLVGAADAVVARTGEVVAGAGEAVERIHATIDGAGIVLEGSAELVRVAGGVLGSAGEMVGGLEGPVAVATPLVARLADAVDPAAVDAVALLLRRLPGLLASVDEDVLPLVRELHQVEPDLHAVLGIVEQLHGVVTAVPGAKRLLRRAEDHHDDGDGDHHGSG
jgi:hypothetical protein